MTQLALAFGNGASGNHRARRTLLPAPWERIDGGRGKIGSRYLHPSGYLIQHCGHPTALWPYALYTPDDYMVIAPNGRAWQNLQAAAIEVDRLLAGGAPRLRH